LLVELSQVVDGGKPSCSMTAVSRHLEHICLAAREPRMEGIIRIVFPQWAEGNTLGPSQDGPKFPELKNSTRITVDLPIRVKTLKCSISVTVEASLAARLARRWDVEVRIS
jgi:hypothetical protein